MHSSTVTDSLHCYRRPRSVGNVERNVEPITSIDLLCSLLVRSLFSRCSGHDTISPPCRSSLSLIRPADADYRISVRISAITLARPVPAPRPAVPCTLISDAHPVLTVRLFSLVSACRTPLMVNALFAVRLTA